MSMREEVTISSFLNVLIAKIEHAPAEKIDTTFDRLWLDIWTSCSKIWNVNTLLRAQLTKGKSTEKTLAIHQHIDRVMTELKRESNSFLGKKPLSEYVRLLKEKNIQEINNILKELEQLKEQTPLKEPLTLDDLLAMAG